jgi:hypothetical protein
MFQILALPTLLYDDDKKKRKEDQHLEQIQAKNWEK